MISQFATSPFKELFDYNDPSVIAWADNVYEKFRQNGILAGYVERDAVTRSIFPVIDGTLRSSILLDDVNNAFGVSYYGDKLTLDNSASSNFGKEYIVEFELRFNEANFSDISMFGADITIKNTGAITFHSASYTGLTFTTGYTYKFKFVRLGLSVTVYIDEVSIGTKGVADTTTTFTVVYDSANAGVAPDFNNDFNDDFLI